MAEVLGLAHLLKLAVGLQPALGVDPFSRICPRPNVEGLPHGEKIFGPQFIPVDRSEWVLDPPGIAPQETFLAAAILSNPIFHRRRSAASGLALGWSGFSSSRTLARWERGTDYHPDRATALLGRTLLDHLRCDRARQRRFSSKALKPPMGRTALDGVSRVKGR